MRGRTVVVMELKTVASSPTVLHLSHILVWHFFPLCALSIVTCFYYRLKCEGRSCCTTGHWWMITLAVLGWYLGRLTFSRERTRSYQVCADKTGPCGVAECICICEQCDTEEPRRHGLNGNWRNIVQRWVTVIRNQCRRLATSLCRWEITRDPASDRDLRCHSVAVGGRLIRNNRLANLISQMLSPLRHPFRPQPRPPFGPAELAELLRHSSPSREAINYRSRTGARC